MPAVQENTNINNTDAYSEEQKAPVSDLDTQLGITNISDDSKSTEEEKPTEESEKETTNEPQKSKRKSEYDPYRVRDFLIRLAKAVKRHNIRVSAHQDFHEHVDKIKKTMVSKKPKTEHNIDKDIDELKKKVASLIDIEKNPNSPNHDKYLQEKIDLLEGKLNNLMQSKQKREDRFTELEKKISIKYDADQETIKELEKKLLLLERKLIEHQIKKKKSKAKINKKDIDEIKEKIEMTKAIIDRHKNM